MSLEAKKSSRALHSSSSASKVFLGGTTEGTGRGGNQMGHGQGNREDGVRPGSQGIRGFPWSPSLCGVLRCREGGMAGIATSSFRKVGATSPSRRSIGGSKGPH